MSWLKRVIARVLGIQTQPLDNHVPPTPIVGLANKEPTTKRGNKRSAQTSTPQRQPATPKSNSKRLVAQPTTPASSRKAKPKLVQPEHGPIGKQQTTPAPRTRQHAKQAPKRKP
jgi:hypothetical protein